MGFDQERARTLYVTGFNPKSTSSGLLKELFMQGGPVERVTFVDTHAYVLFQNEESVPYCLALFNEVELYGQKLRLSPRLKSKESHCYLKYLTAVREKLMTQFMKIPAPELPARRYPREACNKRDKDSSSKQFNPRTKTSVQYKSSQKGSKARLKKRNRSRIKKK